VNRNPLPTTLPTSIQIQIANIHKQQVTSSLVRFSCIKKIPKSKSTPSTTEHHASELVSRKKKDKELGKITKKQTPRKDMQNIESTIGLALEAAAAAAAAARRSHRRARGGGFQTMEYAPMSLLVFACIQVPPPPRCRRRRRPLRLLLLLLLLLPPTIWATSFTPFSGPDTCGTSFRTSCTPLQFDESYTERD